MKRIAAAGLGEVVRCVPRQGIEQPRQHPSRAIEVKIPADLHRRVDGPRPQLTFPVETSTKRVICSARHRGATTRCSRPWEVERFGYGHCPANIAAYSDNGPRPADFRRSSTPFGSSTGLGCHPRPGSHRPWVPYR